MKAVARTPGTRRVPLAILVVAVLALVTPTIGVIASIEFAARQPGHGHIGSGVAIAHHTHAHDDGNTAADDVVFTPSDDGSVASALAFAHPPVDVGFLAAGGIYATPSIEHAAPTDVQTRIPPPPPRA